MVGTCVKFVMFVLSLSSSLNSAQPTTRQLAAIQARVFLFGQPGVKGELFLTQQGDLPLLIQGRVVGLTPGKRVFHIQQ